MNDLLYKQEVFKLVGFCMEIHRGLGKGHDELIYKDALVVELGRADIPFTRERKFEVTYKGVRELEKKDELDPIIRRRRFSLDLVLRRWLNEPGVALFYEGQTVAAQKQTDQVTLMNSKNEAVTLYLDAFTHLPVKKSFSWRDPTDKQRNVEEEIFDNYRLVQGVMTPFDTTRVYNGDMAAQFFVTSSTYNRGLSDNLFDPKQGAPSGKKH